MFDYIEGGVEDERGLARNAAAFHKHRLLPRYLVDVSKRDQTQTIFGRTFSSPFGISPTGGVGLYQRRGGELLLAEAARDANIPYIMSGGSNASMEEAARIAPDNTWFQMYAAKDAGVTDALVGRARDNGLGALVLTVDVPVHPRRERNLRNGFANVRARRRDRGAEAEAVDHHRGADPPAVGLRLRQERRRADPRQLGAACRQGRERSRRSSISAARMTPASAQTWRDLERYRRLFPRTLIVKGILNPADAIRAAEIGVRRHPRVEPRRASARPGAGLARRIAGDQGGGRRPDDRDARQRRQARRRHPDRHVPRRAVRHLRPPDLYGAVACGLPGVKKAIDIFKTEIDLVMGQIGCPSLDQLGPDFLWTEEPGRNR